MHARLIDKLKQSKAIGHTVFFQMPQSDQRVLRLRRLLMGLDRTSLTKDLVQESKNLQSLAATLSQQKLLNNVALGATIERLSNVMKTSSLLNAMPGDLQALLERIKDEMKSLDSELQLSESIKRNGRVFLSMPFILAGNSSRPIIESLPDYVTEHALSKIRGKNANLINSIAGTPPIQMLGRAALATGHLNAVQDADGGVRSEPMLIAYNDTYIPSLSLLLAAKTMNIEFGDISVDLGRGVRVGERFIATDRSMRTQTFFMESETGVNRLRRSLSMT